MSPAEAAATAAEMVAYVPVHGNELAFPTVSVAPAATAAEANVNKAIENSKAIVLDKYEILEVIDFSPLTR